MRKYVHPRGSKRSDLPSEPMTPKPIAKATETRVSVEPSKAVDRWVQSLPWSKQQELAMEQVHEETKANMMSGDWDRATSKHVAMLFSILYDRVYGVPLIWSPKMFETVVKAVERQQKEAFHGDLVGQVEFVRWTWNREFEREQYRYENKITNCGSIQWTWQFASEGTLIHEYRLFCARQAKTMGARASA